VSVFLFGWVLVLEERRGREAVFVVVWRLVWFWGVGGGRSKWVGGWLNGATGWVGEWPSLLSFLLSLSFSVCASEHAPDECPEAGDDGDGRDGLEHRVEDAVGVRCVCVFMCVVVGSVRFAGR
jgi:hypothetical protein